MKKVINRNKFSLILFVIVLVGMGVGYAYLSTTVNFNGNTVINNASWNIYLDNIQVTDGSVIPTTEATIDTNKLSVSYGVKLTNPGDFFEFTVDAKNDGSIDGMIESFSSKLNNVEISNLPEYLYYEVSYSSGADISANDLLKATKQESFKVRIEFKKNITADQLPTEKQTLNLSFSISYKQADENGVEVKHLFTGTIYTVNTSSTGGNVNINQSIAEGIVQYKTPNEVRANFENRPFYLRHMIEKDIVKESYVEFVVTEGMATANEGMTAGTYSLKGADTTAYESNKSVLKTAFGEANCAENPSNFSCSVSNLEAHAGSSGYVNVDDVVNLDHYCRVFGFGTSLCG